jgi:hypothetical protein
LLVLSACATEGHRSDVPRLAWVSIEETLARIATWPDGRESSSPLAILVAIPDDLAVDQFDRVHRAIRARGYGAPHSEPSILDPTTGLTARLALADPVETKVVLSPEAAHVLWSSSIPFGVEAGNSHTAILPRRALPAARRVLDGIVHPETEWPQSAMLPPNLAAAPDGASRRR